MTSAPYRPGPVSGGTRTASAVTTRNLSKRFGQQLAVNGIDLDVPTGAVYGFLGPNGSGKTTTIRMLLGLITPTAGELSLLGADRDRLADALPRVGALVEGPAFHLYLSGRANLERLDAADRRADPRTSAARVDAALDRVGLLPAATKRYRAYSLGMRQRLAIAGALLTPKELLVLDEPTNGLDPQGTREVRHLVADLADEGRTVLVSSHLLSEIEQVCTHVGVMHVGRLVAQGPVASVVGGVRRRVRLETDQPRAAAGVLRQLGVQGVCVEQGVVLGDLAEVAPEKVVAACVHQGLAVTGFQVVTPSLEDAFVALTGEGFDVSG
ncbi:ABC transporter ATP-binding protein [Nocardioides terrisoli]|uniref:ABC transporter ATP-binding protein n=1 Tax=Nocardioides terrisoli TaxID=3388267 RepID=UPI00287B8DDF|nr:ABC transporter ATP-binding protein [Nocardioides marmorisolisilvae]